MKIKTKPEKALYCPKHGRQIYYTTSVGEKPVQWCSRQLTERERKSKYYGEGGSLVAFVTKSGKIVLTDTIRWTKIKMRNPTPIFYAECYEELRERIVFPKKERLLGLVWNLEWSSGIWRCETNRALSVSNRLRKGSPWRYYAHQFNNEESRKEKKDCWLRGGKTRLQAMRAAIRNLRDFPVQPKGGRRGA